METLVNQSTKQRHDAVQAPELKIFEFTSPLIITVLSSKSAIYPHYSQFN